MEVDDDIYITNAGLVILNGYLHFFFQQCEYLDETDKFKPEMAKRAALLLQYVFDPEGIYEEKAMVLNKLLCGLALNEILPDEFVPNEVEKDTTQQMLDAILSHWKMISNSSHEGFRESWLQREGKLTKKETHWYLLVEQRSFDIMLDYKPFTLSPVKFGWMKQEIRVKWR